MTACKICKKKLEQETFCPDCLKLIQKLDFDKFNEERKWTEGLFIRRLNTFLVVFSLIVTAGFANSFENGRSFVFYFGAILLLICWIALIRAYYIYDTHLKILLGQEVFGNKPNQIKILQNLFERRKMIFKKLVISKWLVYWIPITCMVFLIVIGVFIDTDVIINKTTCL